MIVKAQLLNSFENNTDLLSFSSLTVSVLKLDQAGSHSLPRRSKAHSKDDSDEAGIRACQACMDCLERYGSWKLKKKSNRGIKKQLFVKKGELHLLVVVRKNYFNCCMILTVLSINFIYTVFVFLIIICSYITDMINKRKRRKPSQQLYNCMRYLLKILINVSQILYGNQLQTRFANCINNL